MTVCIVPEVIALIVKKSDKNHLGMERRDDNVPSVTDQFK